MHSRNLVINGLFAQNPSLMVVSFGNSRLMEAGLFRRRGHSPRAKRRGSPPP